MTTEEITIHVHAHAIELRLDRSALNGCVRSDMHEDVDPAELGEDDRENHYRWEGAVDAIESVVLAQALAGIPVTTRAYKESLEATLGAIADHIPAAGG